MSNCKKCDKPIAQTPGKRKKEFCNVTCRYLFWYGLNKKAPEKAPSVPKQAETKTPAAKKGSAGKRGGKKKGYKIAPKHPSRPMIVDHGSKLGEYQKELAGLGKGQVAEIRRKWLKKEIKKLEA